MPLLTIATRYLSRRLRAGVQASEKMKVFDFLQQELREQEKSKAEHAKTADEQTKQISFLNDEIKDCASHYYEEVREREDAVAKLAASTEKVREMELTIEVS